MTLTFGQPVIVLVSTALLAAATTYWIYRNTVPELSTVRRLFLGSLRFITLFIVLFLMSEPLWRMVSRRSSPPVLGILIDESRSLSLIGNRSESDSKVNQTTYETILGEIQASIRNESSRLYGFGATTHELPSIDSLELTGPRTDISAALDYVNNALENENLGAVLLVSDGRHNGGRNPEHTAEEYPVPIITVTVGDTTVQKDIRIQQVLANELSYAGMEVPVRVRIRNEGFDSVPVSVALTNAGKILDRVTLDLPLPGFETSTDLAFVPAEPGLFQYRIELTRLAGEATHRNNTELVSLQILDRKKNLFLVAGAPSPDVSSFIQMIETDTDTDLVVRVQRRSGSYFQGDFPRDHLDDIDLIMMVGFPTATTPEADIDALVRASEAGTPVLFVYDRAVDLRRVERKLSSVIPAHPTVIRSGHVDGSFIPTLAALQHAIFDLPDRKNMQRWRSLPPLSLNETQWETNTGTVILASTEIRGISLDNPILLAGKMGRRRSAAILASGLWRWRNVPAEYEADAQRWNELFSNLRQWLVVVEDDRLVRVAPASSELDEGESVVFGGQVYDENLRSVSDASVSLEVRGPSGESFPYSMQSLGNGRYIVDIGSLPQGVYAYSAAASRDGAQIGTDRGTFSVGSLSIEFRNPHADSRLMLQIASRSGGAAVFRGQIGDIPSILGTLDSYAPVARIVERQIRLWQRYPFLIVLIVCLSAEWFFRKRSGLV